ncbi:MAG: ribonuclease P protein component [Acidimicrobiales bacterium]
MWRVRGAGAFSALARPRDHGGTRRRSGPVTLVFIPADRVPTAGAAAPPTHPCVAFAIGRKVGPAVVRNRLRRRLRDELAGLARASSLPAGAYLVALAPAAAALDGPALRAHLRTALGMAA